MVFRIALLWLCLCCTLLTALAQEQRGSYLLGPQDEITITVLRHDELSKNYTIPPDGTIDFPRAGQIAVAGKTMAELSAVLRDKYAGFIIDPQVTVTLAHARIRAAFVLGAVNRPGQYPIGEHMRVTELIASAGDLTWEPKELTANLHHLNMVIPINLLEASLNAKSADNRLVDDGDILWISAPTRITVTVLGQVKNPGAIKLREGSTPIDALAHAGDITERPDRTTITLLRGATTESLNWDDHTTKLQDGDVIQVQRETQTRVFINGQVRNPSAYDLPPGSGVLEALALAGGTLPSAALGQITIVRAKDGSTEQIDLTQTFAKGEVKTNPKLYLGDQVIVPEWTASISVWGKVNRAGKYPISEATPVTVTDAISLAGGADKRAQLASVSVIRLVGDKLQRIPVNIDAVMHKGKLEQNLVLKNNDIVVVPETERPDWSNILDNLSKLGILAGAL